MNLVLPFQNFAVLPFHGEDGDGATHPIHGTVTVDDYAKAYATISSQYLVIVPTVAAPVGGSFDVTVTINAFSADNTALAPVTITVTVQGDVAPPPPPPQATAVIFGTVQLHSPITGNPDVASDPGSGSVSFSL